MRHHLRRNEQGIDVHSREQRRGSPSVLPRRYEHRWADSAGGSDEGQGRRVIVSPGHESPGYGDSGALHHVGFQPTTLHHRRIAFGFTWGNDGHFEPLVAQISSELTAE